MQEGGFKCQETEAQMGNVRKDQEIDSTPEKTREWNLFVHNRAVAVWTGILQYDTIAVLAEAKAGLDERVR